MCFTLIPSSITFLCICAQPQTLKSASALMTLTTSLAFIIFILHMRKAMVQGDHGVEKEATWYKGKNSGLGVRGLEFSYS